MKYAGLASQLMHKPVDLKCVEPGCVGDCLVAKKKVVWEKFGGSDAGPGSKAGGSGRIEKHSDYCDMYRLWQYVAAFITALRSRVAGRGMG